MVKVGDIVRMNQIILYIMAAGVVIGGADRILGNRFGLGKKFEEGFMYLGPMALSMAGIICLAPVLAEFFEWAIAPLCRAVGVDPGMLGGLLAIDMGGYPLAAELADNAEVGRYAGIIVSAIFGCTLVFTIPVGMEMTDKEDHPAFARGIMIGVAVMPVALLIGAIAGGLSLGKAICQTLPILVLAGLLLAGLNWIPEAMVRGFQIFARIIKIVITLGLVLAAIAYLTGWQALPHMAPIEEAMSTVAAIGIVLLGSLPMAELLLRLLERPFDAMGRRLGLDAVSVAGLLIAFVSALPTIAMIKDMSRRGKIVNIAALVCSTSLLGAHLGYTLTAEPGMTGSLLAAKITGALIAAGAAQAITAKTEKRQKG